MGGTLATDFDTDFELTILASYASVASSCLSFLAASPGQHMAHSQWPVLHAVINTTQALLLTETQAARALFPQQQADVHLSKE
jgi:hypothetical protein